MTTRIFRSIIIVTAATLFLSLLITFGVIYSAYADETARELRTETELVAGGMKNSGETYLEALPKEDTRLTLIAPDGTVVYDSHYGAEKMENHLEREEVKQAMADGYGESQRMSDTLTERYIYAAKRLDDGSVLRVSVKQFSILNMILRLIQPILLMVCVVMLLALYLAGRLSKKVAGPITHEIDELQTLAERQRQEFSANVSHELRTPLQSISGYAELIKDGIVASNDIPSFGERIYDEAQRMIHLIEDIISLSHLDENAEPMKWETIDLCEMAKNVIEHLKVPAETKNVSLAFHDECGDECAYVYVIPQLIREIITNIVENAIKYNKNGGHVNVSVKPFYNGRGVVVTHFLLSVADNGIGIPDKEKERIFERFYRVDKSRSKAVGGTGLGLSIVKHAALIHHAKIKVEDNVGGGTVMTVKIPVGQE